MTKIISVANIVEFVKILLVSEETKESAKKAISSGKKDKVGKLLSNLILTKCKYNTVFELSDGNTFLPYDYSQTEFDENGKIIFNPNKKGISFIGVLSKFGQITKFSDSKILSELLSNDIVFDAVRDYLTDESIIRWFNAYCGKYALKDEKIHNELWEACWVLGKYVKFDVSNSAYSLLLNRLAGMYVKKYNSDNTKADGIMDTIDSNVSDIISILNNRIEIIGKDVSILKKDSKEES